MGARRPQYAAVAAAVLILLVSAACSADPGATARHRDQPTGRSTAPAATSFPAASSRQIAVPVGDQVDQSLTQLAADGKVVVAVGQDTSANLSRPMFLRSMDAGQSWQRTTVDAASQDTTGAGEGVDYVTHGVSGFVALGRSGDHRATWLSTDGRRWRRSVIGDDVVGRGEEDSQLVATPDGYMIIGQSRRRHGRVLGTLLTWTSPDGRTWTRHPIPDSVLAGSVGVPSLDQLVVGEDEMIMTGNVENADDPDQPNRIIILRSTDGGSQWTKIKAAPDLAGDYRAYADDLISVDGRYLLLAQGDGADPEGDSWDGVVLSGGAHGRSWHRVAAPTALGSDADDYAHVLLPQPSGSGTSKQHGWLVAGAIGKSPSDGLIAVGDDLNSLHRLHVAPLTGARSQTVTDGVLSGGAAVLIGSDGRTGSDDPMILRVNGSTVTQVRLGDLGGKPVPVVDQLINTGDRYRAVGSLNGTPLLWTSSDGLSWDTRPLPGRGRDGVTDAYATDVAAGPGRTAIAIGTLNRNRGSRLGVWSIAANGRPRQLSSKAFISPAPDDYGYLQARSIAHGPGGWVISAQHTANGRNDIWLLHSTDGRHWTRGRGTVRAQLDRAEKRNHRTIWTAFHAPANGEIIARRVVAVGHGFIALGAIFDQTSVRPVAWRSNDGVTWSQPEDLPLPSGMTDIEITAATVTQGTPGSNRTRVAEESVVVSGQSVPRVAAAERHRISWRLDLAGPPATDDSVWQLGADVVADDSIRSILPISDGFIAVGSATVDGAEDARWWRSADGLAWHRVAVPSDRTAGPGDQRIETVLRSGDGLLLWGWNVPPTGGGDYTRKLPIPR